MWVDRGGGLVLGLLGKAHPVHSAPPCPCHVLQVTAWDTLPSRFLATKSHHVSVGQADRKRTGCGGSPSTPGAPEPGEARSPHLASDREPFQNLPWLRPQPLLTPGLAQLPLHPVSIQSSSFWKPPSSGLPPPVVHGRCCAGHRSPWGGRACPAPLAVHPPVTMKSQLPLELLSGTH